jgi:hypothetical protein
MKRLHFFCRRNLIHFAFQSLKNGSAMCWDLSSSKFTTMSPMKVQNVVSADWLKYMSRMVI